MSTSITRARKTRAASSSIIHRLAIATLLIIGTAIFSNTAGTMSACAEQESPPSKSASSSVEGVITLNAKNFDSSLRDEKAWLIEFYAPW